MPPLSGGTYTAPLILALVAASAPSRNCYCRFQYQRPLSHRDHLPLHDEGNKERLYQLLTYHDQFRKRKRVREILAACSGLVKCVPSTFLGEYEEEPSCYFHGHQYSFDTKSMFIHFGPKSPLRCFL